MNRMPLPLDFYELQKRQKIRSLAVVTLLFLFYLAAIGLLMLAGWMTFGFFAGRAGFFGPGFWFKFLLTDLLFAAGIAAIHYLDARKNGAAYLLKRLGAQAPDPPTGTIWSSPIRSRRSGSRPASPGSKP